MCSVYEAYDKIHFVLLLKYQTTSKTLSFCVATFVYSSNIHFATDNVNVSRHENV